MYIFVCANAELAEGDMIWTILVDVFAHALEGKRLWSNVRMDDVAGSSVAVALSKLEAKCFFVNAQALSVLRTIELEGRGGMLRGRMLIVASRQSGEGERRGRRDRCSKCQLF